MREAIHLSGGFHTLMAELSGNAVLADQVRLLVARTSLIVKPLRKQLGLAGWHDHHEDLIAHCEKHEVEKAVALMRDHIAEIRDALALDRRGRFLSTWSGCLQRGNGTCRQGSYSLG